MEEFIVYDIVNGCSKNALFEGSLDECREWSKSHNDIDLIIVNS